MMVMAKQMLMTKDNGARLHRAKVTKKKTKENGNESGDSSDNCGGAVQHNDGGSKKEQTEKVKRKLIYCLNFDFVRLN